MTAGERRRPASVPGWVSTLAGLDRRWNGGNVGLTQWVRLKPTGRARVEGGRHRPEAVEERLARERADTQVIPVVADRSEPAYAESS